MNNTQQSQFFSTIQCHIKRALQLFMENLLFPFQNPDMVVISHIIDAPSAKYDVLSNNSIKCTFISMNMQLCHWLAYILQGKTLLNSLTILSNYIYLLYVLILKCYMKFNKEDPCDKNVNCFSKTWAQFNQ